jgi:hypothetical protein
MNFCKEQNRMLCYAQSVGLSKEQIKFFYKPEFSSSHMISAIRGFQDSLTIEEVSSYYSAKARARSLERKRIVLTKRKKKNGSI